MWKIILLSCALIYCVSSVRVEKTNTNEAEAAVSVIWDSGTNSAYYTDFGTDSTQPCLFRYDACKKRSYSASVHGPSLGTPGFIIPIKSGSKLYKFAVGFANFVAILYWNGKSPTAAVGELIYDQTDRFGPRERLGFGRRDQSGRSIYSGTISLDLCSPAANQSSYVKQRGHEYRRVLTDLKLPAGWAVSKGHAYILDSCTGKLWAIPNSKCDGACGIERLAFDFNTIATSDFIPIGLEPDVKGNLLTVNYYDGSIYRITPFTLKAKKVAQLPTGAVTSLSFGGDNGKGQDLYVTVAKRRRNFGTGEVTAHQSPGTALYKVEGLGAGPSFKRVKV